MLLVQQRLARSGTLRGVELAFAEGDDGRLHSSIRSALRADGQLMIMPDHGHFELGTLTYPRTLLELDLSVRSVFLAAPAAAIPPRLRHVSTTVSFTAEQLTASLAELGSDQRQLTAHVARLQSALVCLHAEHARRSAGLHSVTVLRRSDGALDVCGCPPLSAGAREQLLHALHQDGLDTWTAQRQQVICSTRGVQVLADVRR